VCASSRRPFATGFLSFGLDPQLGVGDRAAHDLERQVNVWTVSDVAQVELLRHAGVDALITDDTELYRFGARGGGVRG
jgi:hypothetical protein